MAKSKKAAMPGGEDGTGPCQSRIGPGELPPHQAIKQLSRTKPWAAPTSSLKDGIALAMSLELAADFADPCARGHQSTYRSSAARASYGSLYREPSMPHDSPPASRFSLPLGEHPLKFEWPGRTWFGASDTGNMYGPAVAPGNYFVKLTLFLPGKTVEARLPFSIVLLLK